MLKSSDGRCSNNVAWKKPCILKISVMEESFIQKTSQPENPRSAKQSRWVAASMDCSNLPLAFRRDGDRDSYSEVDENFTCVSGARCARKVVFGLASYAQLTLSLDPR